MMCAAASSDSLCIGGYLLRVQRGLECEGDVGAVRYRPFRWITVPHYEVACWRARQQIVSSAVMAFMRGQHALNLFYG
jgi:hypothetical protein